MATILIRLLPWIAGAASIAGVLLWAQQSGVKLAVHEQTTEQLELIQEVLEARESAYDKEWTLVQQYLSLSTESRARLAGLVGEINELDTPECNDLGPDWVRLYNASVR